MEGDAYKKVISYDVSNKKINIYTLYMDMTCSYPFYKMEVNCFRYQNYHGLQILLNKSLKNYHRKILIKP